MLPYFSGLLRTLLETLEFVGEKTSEKFKDRVGREGALCQWRYLPLRVFFNLIACSGL